MYHGNHKMMIEEHSEVQGLSNTLTEGVGLGRIKQALEEWSSDPGVWHQETGEAPYETELSKSRLSKMK